MSAEDRMKVIAKHAMLHPSGLKGDNPSSISLQKKLCSVENSKESTTGGVPSNTNSADLNKQRAPKPIQSAVPKIRQELLKWNGWGYKDSQFIIKDEIIHFTGNRYPIGEQALPYFTEWVKDVMGVDIYARKIPQPMPKAFPEPVVDKVFINELQELNIDFSLDGCNRLVRAHGQTLHDIFMLRGGEFVRIPDVVVWPGCHDHVVSLVQLANRHNVVVIPFGGGTSVSGAVTCPEHEQRTIMSLDTSQMNRILWVDHENLVACVEAGIIGQDLERELQKQNVTTGHEPDSHEFSSVGGWVATRASGMRKNVYGNIEDMLIHVRMVTPTGVLEKHCRAPRISCGPDFNHVVLGSEGTLGVITEIMLKVRPLPAVKKYGSIVFPNFEAGVACLREVARQRCQPASIRLMDNEQFQFGQALRPTPGYFGLFLEGIKKMYITKIKGFNLNKICVATLVFEGERSDVEIQEKKIFDIALQTGGFPAGEKNGQRGYMLTFVIAYIRDLGLEFSIVAESFETSVAWDRAVSLCTNVKHRLARECKARNIYKHMISCRVTQTYDTGCCIYFYFALNWKGQEDPLRTYEEIEQVARDEILASGGSLSHHHGIGKIRQRWFESQVSQLGVSLFNATKRQLDPNNIFAVGNLHKAHL